MDPELQAAQDSAGWNLIRKQVRGRVHDQVAMEHYFDGLTVQGVLFLNAAWTFTEIEKGIRTQENEYVDAIEFRMRIGHCGGR